MIKSRSRDNTNVVVEIYGLKMDKRKFIKLSEIDLKIMKNIIGAFFAKGASLLVNFLLLPLYINFFHNKTVLGVWYTMLSVLNWVNLFDLGLGHGLRNKLPIAIEKQDKKYMTDLISTTYGLMILISGFILIVGEIGISKLNWNRIFNVDASIISNILLIDCVQIVFLGVVINIILKIVTSILYAMQYSAIVSFLTLIPNIIITVCLNIMPSGDLEMNLKMMSIINICAINIPYIICTFIVFKYLLKGSYFSLKNIKTDCVKDIFSIGISLLWLQLVFMVISSTNEIVISKLTSMNYVIEYQVYYRIFSTVGMAVALLLAPIWSAVTKAQVQKNFNWIKKIYKIFLLTVFVCILLELCIIPLLPWIVRIWLGESVINVNQKYALAFICSSAIFVLHNVNTSIGNGLSYFKVQMIWMTFAALVFIPLSYILVQVTGSWIGVVVANTIALVPYEFIAPIFTFRMLNEKLNNKIE